jgi:hypothetical protein
MSVTGQGRAQLAEDPVPDREWRLLEVLRQRPFLIVLDGLDRLLLAYARTDSAYLDDTAFDEDPATAVGGTSDGPRDKGTLPADARHQRWRLAGPHHQPAPAGRA